MFLSSFWKIRAPLPGTVASPARGLSLCSLAGPFPEILSPGVPLIKNQLCILFQCYPFDEVTESTDPRAIRV